MLKLLRLGITQLDKIVNLVTGEESKSGLPSSNVLYYVLEDGTWFCVRPSGTEPKIKIYFGSSDKNADAVDAKLKSGRKWHSWYC